MESPGSPVEGEGEETGLGGTIDLDWKLLDSALTESVISFLASAFDSAPRPSYLDQIAVSSFSFGVTPPSVSVLDIKDIFKEFLDVEDEEDGLLDSPPLPPPPPPVFTPPTQPPPPASHEWHSAGSGIHSLRRPILNPQPSSSLFSPGLHGSYTPPTGNQPNRFSTPNPSASPSSSTAPSFGSPSTPPPSSSSSPSLQLHLRVNYTGNLTIGLSTSLLINYPSPRFMALPLKLLLTSLAFSGTFLVAFEGDRRRIHISILDPLAEDRAVNLGPGWRGGLTAGGRLLTGAVVESEVGQADKHVLKNVGKVEKFVLDVVRAALERELVFP